MGGMLSLVLRVASLVEAEGRVARRAANELIVALAVMLVAAGLAVLTVAAACIALFFALERVLSPAGALGIVAAILALLTVIAALVAGRLGGSLQSRPGPRR